MAITEVASSTVVTDGTEQTLTTQTTAGLYVPYLDLSDLVNGDVLEISARVKVRAASTARTIELGVAGHVQDAPAVALNPIPVGHSIALVVKQTAGTASIPWSLLRIYELTAVADGQVTTDGTEQPLGSAVTDDGVYVCLVDLGNMAGGATPDVIRLRSKLKVTSGGAAVPFDVGRYDGVQIEPVVMFDPMVVVHEGSWTIQRAAGTDRAYDWAVLKRTP